MTDQAPPKPPVNHAGLSAVCQKYAGSYLTDKTYGIVRFIEILQPYEDARQADEEQRTRDRQGGFMLGDEVHVVGQFAKEWEASGKITIAGINIKIQGGPAQFTLAEEGNKGLTDGWMAGDLVRVQP